MAEDAQSMCAYPTEKPLQLPMVTDSLVKVLVEEMTGTPNGWSEWEQTGNVVMDVLSWLWDGVAVDKVRETGTGDLIDAEFDMYRQHLSNVQGKIIAGGTFNVL